MGKCDDMLLVSDFDRTLTNNQNQVPQANIEAIHDFIREGGLFTVATGQSVNSQRKRYDRVPLNAPTITFNGAAVYDFCKEEALYLAPLPSSAEQMAKELVRNFPDCVVSLETLRNHYLLHQADSVKQRAIAKIFGMDDREQRTPEQDQEQWLKIVIVYLELPETEEEIMQRLGQWKEQMGEKDFFRETDEGTDARMKDIACWVEERFPGEYTVARSMPMMLEIQAAGVSKGSTARKLAREYGRKTLICVGDAPNDVGMLEEADFAYIAADGDAGLLDGRYRLAAPSHEGTVASVIRELLNT